MTVKTKNVPAVVAPAAPVLLSQEHAQTIADLVLGGDLSQMDNPARVRYYKQLCDSLHLNPLTQPFLILKLQGKEILYATKSCTEQLRKLWGVSVTNIDARQEGSVYLVVAHVQDAEGRTDAASGVVALTDSRGNILTGENLANAFMKAETKAKRRATLSICGLGMLDESELDTLPQATRVSLPAAAELGTSATVVAEAPAPLASVEGELLSGQTRKLILLALDAYNADAAGGEGYEAKLLDNLETMLEVAGQKVLAWLEKQPKKRSAGKRGASVPSEAGPCLMDEFKDHPTADDRSPVQFATPSQKMEIKRLIELPVITRRERTLMILNINRLDESRAQDAINKLTKTVEEREGGAGAAAVATAA